MKRHLLIATALVATGLAAVSPAFAQSQGEWTLGLGLANVNPKSNNGDLAGGTVPTDIGDSTRPTITFEYFIRDNIGIEVLGALPFSHTIKSKGVEIGKVKQLPPVVSLQYHFNATPQFKPFVGVGVNFTAFFSTKTEGAIAGTDLDLSNSWGLAGHLGIDFQVSEKGAIRVDYRKIDIDTNVKLNGADLGTNNTVNIDPSVYGIAYVFAF